MPYLLEVLRVFPSLPYGAADHGRVEGVVLGHPESDDLVALIKLAGGEFNSDWARAIREGVTAGHLPLERIIIAKNPEGEMIGWAQHGTYEQVIERFGPFGVLPSSRGTGLGKVILHLTMENMTALGMYGWELVSTNVYHNHDIGQDVLILFFKKPMVEDVLTTPAPARSFGVR